MSPALLPRPSTWNNTGHNDWSLESQVELPIMETNLELETNGLGWYGEGMSQHWL
jgi:hypothetical protein